MALIRAQHSKFILTPNKFWYLRIMLPNAYIIFFSDRASATTCQAARCAITALLARRLGGWTLITTRHASTTHLAHKLGGWTSQNYSDDHSREDYDHRDP
jgi:hypothetical protein